MAAIAAAAFRIVMDLSAPSGPRACFYTTIEHTAQSTDIAIVPEERQLE